MIQVSGSWCVFPLFPLPCLDSNALDISGFPTTIFKGIEAEAGGFVFFCSLEVRIH